MLTQEVIKFENVLKNIVFFFEIIIISLKKYKTIKLVLFTFLFYTHFSIYFLKNSSKFIYVHFLIQKSTDMDLISLVYRKNEIYALNTVIGLQTDNVH